MKRLFTFLLFVFSTPLWALNNAVPNANELVSILDSYRGYNDSGFTMQTTTVSYKKNRKPRTNQVLVKVLGDKSHVTFESPAREKGRMILSRDNNMWIYFPGTRKVVRISAAQKLLGEASNGDILGTALSTHYSAKIIGEAKIEETDTFKLELLATHKKASYPRIVFYMDKDSQHKPIKSDYFSRSGKLLKSAFYKGFMKVNGEEKIHKMLFINPLIEGSYTWMRFDNMHKSQLPETLFNKSNLVN
ncbi:MAG: outer membrane lipoprotein-sorting protein [Bermanella sp.]